MLTMVNSSGYVERVVSDLIVSGQYRRHLSRLRERIERATASTTVALSNLGMKVFGAPNGGYYLSCELSPEIDEIELAKRAAKRASFSPLAQSFIPTERLSSQR